jgi:hypothetical protein
MPNHIHLLVRTPEPNLSSGMQHWLSGYANWYAKRNRRRGPLFQGRYKSFLVEDAGYFWTLSRYIHLNPCVGSRPLASAPERWPHSSYAGYARKTARSAFVQYEALHDAWMGECGGKDAASAYRRYVAEGLGVSENPLESALREWVIGSEDFLKRMVALAEQQDGEKGRRLVRRMRVVTMDQIIEATAAEHGVASDEYVGFRSLASGREMAALLCRRYTSETLPTLSKRFGLQGADSSSNLVRKARRREEKSAAYRRKMSRIENKLRLKTGNQT